MKKHNRPPDKPEKEKAPTLPAPGAFVGQSEGFASYAQGYNIYNPSSCQAGGENFSQNPTSDYTRLYHTRQAQQIVEQAKAAMDAADEARDLDAWVDAFTTYISVFTDAYPPAELTGKLSTDIDITLQQLEQHRRLAHHYGELAELHTTQAAACRVQLSELESLIPSRAGGVE